MSLNFLSPIYLFGLLGVSVPVLIHLLARRKQKILFFSAIHILLKSKERPIKRSIPNRKFLLLIRCMSIALISLALANPIFSFGEPTGFESNSPSANVFILDDSYSMDTKVNQKSYYILAKEALADMVQALPNKSVYSIVLGSSPSRVLQDWTENSSKAKKLLHSNQSSSRNTEIGPAIKEALRLLSSTPQKVKRINILTDRDKNGWKEGEFSPIEKVPYPVNIIDFSEMREGPNRAGIEEINVKQEFLSNRRMIRVKVKVANRYESKPISKLKVSLWINNKKQTGGTINIPVKSSSEKEFYFPLQQNNSINGEVRIENDLLSKDNKRYFNYQPDQTIKTLVVDGDPKTIEHQSETFYLERALNPFTVSLSNIDPTLSTIAQLSVHDLFDYSVVMLCNVRNLPFGYEQELEKFVMRGGALFISLGDQVDAKFYNEKLGNILPVYLKTMYQVTGSDKPIHFFTRSSKHPVLKVFNNQTLQEMKSISFRSIYTTEPREEFPFSTPMIFENKFPALIESITGEGKVILFVSSIDRDWNNFAIQPTFLPWIQRWVKYSARSLESLSQKKLLVGESFLWKKKSMNLIIYITSPKGEITPLSNKDGEVEFKDTYIPGIYQLYQGPLNSSSNKGTEPIFQLPYGAKSIGFFTVNIDPKESLSKKISNKEIKSLLPGTNLTFFNGYQKLNLNDSEGDIPIYSPLMLLVGLMILVEGWMVRKE